MILDLQSKKEVIVAYFVINIIDALLFLKRTVSKQ